MDGVSYTTYTVSLTLGGSAANVYTIYGDEDTAMSFPPVYQAAAPFGANVGGVDAALVKVLPTAAFDSWLTVGITDGDSAGALSNIGLDWDGWGPSSGLYTTNGAVFWMTPDDATGDTGEPVVVAQLTVPAGTGFTVTLNAEGRGSSRRFVGGKVMGDWKSSGLTCTVAGDAPYQCADGTVCPASAGTFCMGQRDCEVPAPEPTACEAAATAETACKDSSACSACHDFNFGDDCAANSREHCAEIDCCAPCEAEIRAMWACEHGSTCGETLACAEEPCRAGNDPCKNGGACESTTAGAYTCTCAVGFTGENCDSGSEAATATLDCAATSSTGSLTTYT